MGFSLCPLRGAAGDLNFMGARTLLLLFLEVWVRLRGCRGSAEEKGEGGQRGPRPG